MSTTTLAPSTNGQAPEQLTSSPTKSLLSRLGERFGVDAEKMLGTLKQTAFRQRADKSGQIKDVTTEQMMALLIVADQYHLNPWTREIYAFPQDGGIVPIVGVDGWIRMMNEHPQFDGVQFVDGPEVGDKPNLVNEWIECQIFRKDRSHPIVVREYIVECRKDTGPWRSHPRRMLRHKALIQCCRIAFGFAGIHDEDEGLTVADGIATVKKDEPQWPTGRVHHHRIAHSVKQAEPAVDTTAEPVPEPEDFPVDVVKHDPVDTPPVTGKTIHPEWVDTIYAKISAARRLSLLEPIGDELVRDVRNPDTPEPDIQEYYPALFAAWGMAMASLVKDADKPRVLAKIEGWQKYLPRTAYDVLREELR